MRIRWVSYLWIKVLHVDPSNAGACVDGMHACILALCRSRAEVVLSAIEYFDLVRSEMSRSMESVFDQSNRRCSSHCQLDKINKKCNIGLPLGRYTREIPPLSSNKEYKCRKQIKVPSWLTTVDEKYISSCVRPKANGIEKVFGFHHVLLRSPSIGSEQPLFCIPSANNVCLG